MERLMKSYSENRRVEINTELNAKNAFFSIAGLKYFILPHT